MEEVWRILIQHLKTKIVYIYLALWLLFEESLQWWYTAWWSPMMNLLEMCLLQNYHLEDKTGGVQRCWNRVKDTYMFFLNHCVILTKRGSVLADYQKFAFLINLCGESKWWQVKLGNDFTHVLSQDSIPFVYLLKS